MTSHICCHREEQRRDWTESGAMTIPEENESWKIHIDAMTFQIKRRQEGQRCDWTKSGALTTPEAKIRRKKINSDEGECLRKRWFVVLNEAKGSVTHRSCSRDKDRSRFILYLLHFLKDPSTISFKILFLTSTIAVKTHSLILTSIIFLNLKTNFPPALSPLKTLGLPPPFL